MDEIEDILMDTILSTLSEKVDPKLLRKANTKAVRNKLLKRLTKEFFYKLLKEKKLPLSPGFGSVVLKEIREKDKKIYNKKTGTMDIKRVGGHKVVYKPGDTVREFL